MSAVTDFDTQMLTARANIAAGRRWPGAAVSDPRPLPGGVSSLTYRATLHRPGTDDLPIVLKMAPPGLAPVRNRDVLRQARIMHALGPADGVPVPEVVFTGEGVPGDLAIPPLFAMTLVEGQSYEPLLDTTPDPPTAAVVARRAVAAAETLARMQDLDRTALGCGAEPVLPVTAELDRWQRLLGTVDDDIVPRHRELYAALARRMPRPLPPTLVHGDYRLANIIFAGPEPAAIIDWEIWSVGDPRTDLAWLLMHTDPVHRFRTTRPAADTAAGHGMPPAAVLLDAYCRIRGEVPDLDWFVAYCLYKTASTISVFVKRNRRRDHPDPALVVAADSLPAVVERGLELLAGPVAPSGS